MKKLFLLTLAVIGFSSMQASISSHNWKNHGGPGGHGRPGNWVDGRFFVRGSGELEKYLAGKKQAKKSLKKTLREAAENMQQPISNMGSPNKKAKKTGAAATEIKAKAAE